jgi:hypothetical protein
MAGEWLKFETNTPEKAEVFAITAALGWPDPDLTVGKLLKVWRWFDQQTIGGNAPGVTLSLLDSISGVSGFAKSMCDVGWLISDEAGLRLPKFDRHNGKTAKDRALTAKRVATHKAKTGANDEGNADSVSSALPRREEKREEENIKPLKSKTEARGTRIPSDWIAPEPYIAFCQAERPDLNPMFMQDKFRDYWHPKPGKDGLKLDWLGTWRNFIRSERAPQARGSPGRAEKFDPSAYVNRKGIMRNERPFERTIEFDEHGQPL